MAHTYRLNDDGTVQVKHNGVWLTLDEVLDLKDRQLADSRKEVLELDKERERLEYEKNLPAPQVIDSGSDDEYETIIERSFNGDQITYTTRKDANSGSLIASGGFTTTTSTWSNIGAAEMTYPKIQVQRGGLTYTSPPSESELRGEAPKIAWVDETESFAPEPKKRRWLRRNDMS